jgi:hypothetical protein
MGDSDTAHPHIHLDESIRIRNRGMNFEESFLIQNLNGEHKKLISPLLGLAMVI